MGKAQISMEYLIIIGLSFAVLIPTAYMFYNYSQVSNDETIRLQVNQIGQEMLRNAETIYGLSEGSLKTVEVKYPSNIRDLYILNNNELVIRYELSSGTSDAVFFSKVPITGYFTLARAACALPCQNSTLSDIVPQAGKHNIRFESRTSYVAVKTLR